MTWVAAVCLDRINVRIEYTLVFVKCLIVFRDCCVQRDVALPEIHCDMRFLLFVLHHISHDQQKRHAVRI